MMGPPSVLVVGAGSIGRRHRANLSRHGASVTMADVDRSRLTDIAEPTLLLADDIPGGFDAVVVASPTTRHAEQASAALATGAFVFVEKPLATSVEAAHDLIGRGDGRLMVGYNLRFHAPLQRVAELLYAGAAGRPLSHRFWFGQWLPDWRPAVDYRISYSARSDLGGGVLFDAIHELDLAVWFAGPDLRVRAAVVDRVGPLEIDVEDTVRALLTTPDGVPVTIDLDYLSRRYRRGVEVIGDRATIAYDWSTGDLTVATAEHVEVEHFDTPVGESYEAEMAAFLQMVEHRTPSVNTASEALVSLELAESIREASRGVVVR
jgi:predicted dehydrogenase